MEIIGGNCTALSAGLNKACALQMLRQVIE